MARRQRERFDYIYGVNPVLETLRGRRSHNRILVRNERRDDQRIKRVIQQAEERSIAVEYVDRNELERRSEGGNHQGVVLESGPFQYVDIDEMMENAGGRTILVLDHVQDPQNLATLIRTAAAVHAGGVIIQTDRSAQVTPAVVRSSAGLVEIIPVARENNTRRALETLKRSGYWAIALESTDRSENIYTADLPQPAALVVGSEERGIAGNALKECDVIVELPMPGEVESLNAAVAGSVALFELLRRNEG